MYEIIINPFHSSKSSIVYAQFEFQSLLNTNWWIILHKISLHTMVKLITNNELRASLNYYTIIWPKTSYIRHKFFNISQIYFQGDMEFNILRKITIWFANTASYSRIRLFYINPSYHGNNIHILIAITYILYA